MNELEQIYQALGGDYGTITQIVSWIGAIRIPMKTVSAKIESKITEALVKVCKSPETDDDEIVRRILRAKGYRWTAFTLDFLFSFKLPCVNDFSLMFEQRQQQPK